MTHKGWDLGNRFVSEDVYISRDGKEVARASLSHGQIDPLKTEVKCKQVGEAVLEKLAKPFGMTSSEFAGRISSRFIMDIDCLKLFMSGYTADKLPPLV